MNRRTCLAASLLLCTGTSGCIGDDRVAAPRLREASAEDPEQEPDDSDDDDDDVQETPGDDAEDDTSVASDDSGDDDATVVEDADGTEPDTDDAQSDFVEFLPDGIFHHWPIHDFSTRMVEDTISQGDGYASDNLAAVEGEFFGGVAAQAEPNGGAHIDLGYVQSINEAANDRSLTMIATIEPALIESDRAMTILGAGGGDSDWIEFRLNTSTGDLSGQPNLLLRDGLGNTISAAADHAIEPDDRARVGVSLSGETAADLFFWINGDPVEATVITDDGLSTTIDPEQAFGIFASNPRSERSIGIRRYFSGVIDNVIVARQPVTEEDIEADFQAQPWTG